MAKFNLKALMELVKNGQFVGIDMQTEVKLNKTLDPSFIDTRPDLTFEYATKNKTKLVNPHFGHVSKLVTGSRVWVGASYEKMVQQRLINEGKTKEEAKAFVSNPLPWGEYVEGGFPVIVHNGKFYLRVIFETAGTTSYLFDGKPIMKESILGLSEKSEGNGQGGLSEENKVHIRNIGFDSILRVRAASQELKGPFDWR